LLGALCGCYLSVEQSINSLITGCVMVGVCGQLSETEKGNGSFGLNLMDYLSVISDTQIENLLDFEVKKL
jgi:hydroxyethylthiazole kinase